MPEASLQGTVLTVRWKGGSCNRLVKAKGNRPCKASDLDGGKAEGHPDGVASRKTCQHGVEAEGSVPR